MYEMNMADRGPCGRRAQGQLRNDALASGAARRLPGESLPMVGRILGHTQAQTTARYSHLADDALQRASERVASSLKQAMDDETCTVSS